MPSPQSASTVEYALLAVFVVCAVLAAFAYVWPDVEPVLRDFKLLGELLAGAK